MAAGVGVTEQKNHVGMASDGSSTFFLWFFNPFSAAARQDAGLGCLASFGPIWATHDAFASLLDACEPLLPALSLTIRISSLLILVHGHLCLWTTQANS